MSRIESERTRRAAIESANAAAISAVLDVTSQRSGAARLMGRARTEKKTAAARENGKRGGRPPNRYRLVNDRYGTDAGPWTFAQYVTMFADVFPDTPIREAWVGGRGIIVDGDGAVVAVVE